MGVGDHPYPPVYDKKQGVNPPRSQGYPSASGAVPPHLPRSQSLACADGSPPPRPSLTSLPPIHFSLCPGLIGDDQTGQFHSYPSASYTHLALCAVRRASPDKVPVIGVDRTPAAFWSSANGGFCRRVHPTGMSSWRQPLCGFLGVCFFPTGAGVFPMRCIGRLERFQPSDAHPTRLRGCHPVALRTAPDVPAPSCKKSLPPPPRQTFRKERCRSFSALLESQ